MKIPTWMWSWPALALLISFVSGMAGIASLAAEIGHPFGGYFSYSVALEDLGYVDLETPDWWPIFELGQEVEGQLITVEGHPYTPTIRDTFESKEPGDPVIIEIIQESDEQQNLLYLDVITFTFNHFLDIKIPEIIVAVSFWILAIIVLRTNPHSPTNQVFALIAAIVAAQRLLNGHTLFLDNRFLPNVLESAHLIASAFVGVTAFHFAWLYPTPLENRPTWAIRFLYGLAVLAALACVGGRVTWWPSGINPPNVFLTTVGYQAVLILFFVGLITLITRLVYSAVKAQSSRRERRILVITMVGILIALPVLVLSTADVIPGQDARYFWAHLDLRYLLVAIPLALALAIIRYQNMTTPSRVFILVAVLAGSALLANIAAWLWQLAYPELTMIENRPPFIPFFIAIFTASLFWSMQTSGSGWMSRFLHRETMNFTATRDVGRRIQSARDLDALPQTLASAVADELGLECTAVWLADGEAGQFNLEAVSGGSNLPLPQTLAFPAKPLHGKPIRLSDLSNLPSWLAPLAAQGAVEIAAPLYRDTEPLAVLGFGHRWDEDVFDERDLVIIELIGQQALLYLQVAQQIEELRQVPHRISAAQERERTLLAAELHDTIQQFLGRLPFFLVASREAMRDDPDEASELLERSLSDIEEAAITVQQIRQNLAPNQLDRSLSRSLHSLAARVHQRYGVRVKLSIRGEIDQVTDLETRLALYRVIQHALDNVIAHSGASSASVALQQENGRLAFTISDDGQGASPRALQEARLKGHFGLQSMKARMEACGGELEFQSIVGKGTHIHGWAPVSQSIEG